MRNVFIVPILIALFFFESANSQIKTGKPPGGGGGGGLDKISLKEIVLKSKIDKFVKNARKNAKAYDLKFEKANLIDFSTAIKIDQSMTTEICAEADASGGDSHPEKKDLGKLSERLFDKKSLKLLREILEDEKLFKDHIQHNYNISESQAKDVFETYKWLIDLGSEK